MHKLSVHNLPGEEKGYASSDLWVPHPTKPDFWRMCVALLLLLSYLLSFFFLPFIILTSSSLQSSMSSHIV